MKEILIFIHERINCLYNYFVNLILLIIKCWQSQLLFPLCRSSDLRTQLRTLILLHVTLSQYQAHNRTNQDWMKQQIKILLVECIIITKKKPDVLQVLVNSSPWPASRCHLLVMPTSAETQSAMDSSTISKSPPKNGVIYCICDNAYHKQEPCFPLFKLGQIVILP